jgi:hypothetical protein
MAIVLGYPVSGSKTISISGTPIILTIVGTAVPVISYVYAQKTISQFGIPFTMVSLGNPVMSIRIGGTSGTGTFAFGYPGD